MDLGIKDTKDIRLSQKASDVANTFKERYFFPDAISVAKLAFAYKLLSTTEEQIIGWCVLGNKKDDCFDTNGNNYSAGNIDGIEAMREAVKARFPNFDAPHTYIRLLMDQGLVELGEKIHSLEDLAEFLKEL